MESELIAFVTNQGLGIGLAAFLVWWVELDSIGAAGDTELMLS